MRRERYYVVRATRARGVRTLSLARLPTFLPRALDRLPFESSALAGDGVFVTLLSIAAPGGLLRGAPWRKPSANCLRFRDV
jgi:hypothetical protein